MVSPQKFLKLVRSWETRPRRNSVAHFEGGNLPQRRRIVVEMPEPQVGNGAGSPASRDPMGVAGDSRGVAVADSSFCNSTWETFWKGSRDAGLLAIEQQRRSKLACSAQLGREEGWGCRECLVSKGQQLWREGEGSGLWAGEAPAGTTTAARDWMPVHAITRWLTDQASSATIRTTPIDRLLSIADGSVRSAPAFCCDSHHTGPKSFRCSYRPILAPCGRLCN